MKTDINYVDHNIILIFIIMSNREEQNLQDELQELINSLISLQVQQNEVQDSIGRVLQTIEQQTNDVNTPVAQPVVDANIATQEERELHYTDTFRPRVNNEVRILSPNTLQSRTGIVSGFTRDGKLKIWTRYGTIIQRAPRNVVCVRRHHE